MLGKAFSKRGKKGVPLNVKNGPQGKPGGGGPDSRARGKLRPPPEEGAGGIEKW